MILSMKQLSKFALGAACLLLLAACQTTGVRPEIAASNSMTHVASAEETASLETVAALEKIYTRDPSKADAALKYATALQQTGSSNRAAVVLAPFANSAASPAAIKTEYANIQLALGNDEAAEKYANKAIAQDPKDAHAWHYLGISLDAQEKLPEAEKAFRKAIELWKGDPTPVMNNLALNLSAQGYLDQAADVLQKAKATAPDKVEIERNLRIITALRQSENPTTPKPGVKPTP